MKRYLRIYLIIAKLNLSGLIAYRANFFKHGFSSIIWGVFQIITTLILTSKVSSIYGWSQGELLILVTIFNIFIGIYHMLFSPNFERFSEIIHYGEFDALLIKPIDCQFSATFWIVNFSSLLRTFFSLAFLIYLIGLYDVSFGLIEFLGFLITLIIGIVLLYSLWLLVTTITFWNSRLSNLVNLMFTFNGFSRFPREMFDAFRNIALVLILPFILVVSTPTKILLNKPFLNDLSLMMFFTVLLFFLSRFFWNFALKYYTSAGG